MLYIVIRARTRLITYVYITVPGGRGIPANSNYRRRIKIEPKSHYSIRSSFLWWAMMLITTQQSSPLYIL
jgi:hypothetical protein